MYKVSLTEYKLTRANDLQDVVDVINDGNPIISYSDKHSVTYEPEELFKRIAMIIGNEGTIILIPNISGLRAKIAELILSNNYAKEIPQEITKHLD